MPSQEDRVKRLFAYSKKAKILEGKVWVQGGRIEWPGRKITYIIQSRPLYFDPHLETAKGYDLESMSILLDYLKNFYPIDEKGMIFFPLGIFYLQSEKCLQLSMWDDKPSGQGTSISVFDRRKWNPRNFEESVNLFKDKKVSSSVFGEFRRRIDYPDHTLLRRYFAE